VEHLLACGAAYWDYASPEEIAAERQRAIDSREGVFRYSRRWMAETAAQRSRFESEGRKGVVRLKMPTEGTFALNDLVRGRVEFEWAREQDHVVMRADGTFLYHLASVVDDSEMGITHVIRAEEHLSNTPRQVFIVKSLDCAVPEYAHLPYVAEPGSKNKLSKRKIREYLKNRDFSDLVQRGSRVASALGLDPNPDLFSPVLAEFYQQVGFLSDAVVNYLALLGWSLDDRTEQFTREELVRDFSLERVSRAPASFDPGKLLAFQVRRMLNLTAAQRADLVLPYLQQVGRVASKPDARVKQRVEAVVEAAGDRIKVAGDVLDYLDFFVSDDELTYDETAFERAVRVPGAADLLGRMRDLLAGPEARWDADALEKSVLEFIHTAGIKPNQVVHALRVALTGKAVGFGLYQSMAILGRDSCLARIDRARRTATGGGT
jgi:glutamyl-tRNA synthetase